MKSKYTTNFYHWFGTALSMLLAGLISLTFPGDVQAQDYDEVYTVTVVTKTSEHPHFEEGYSEGYAIDGTEGAEITLTRGNTYAFVMDNVPSFHPFYITTNEVGNGDGEYNNGVTNNGADGTDTLTFTPPSDAPDLLYYQCVNHDYMGYRINIQDPVSMSFTARLSGSSEVPSVATTGSGMVTAQLEGDSLFLSGTFEGLSSDFNANIGGGSHLHLAPAGSNGGVEIPLNVSVNADMRSGTFVEADNSFELSSEQKSALMARKFYVNIHTVDHPAGELRGQLLRADADAHFEAILTAGSQTHRVNSNAMGGAVAELHGDSLWMSGSFHGLESDFNADVGGGTHLHMAPAGQAGSVTIALNADVSSDVRSGTYEITENRYELTTEQKTALMARELYVNVHTVTYGAGELRGQLVPRSDAYFEGLFSGAAEVGPVETTGTGAVFAEVRGDSLFLTGSFMNLSSDFDANVGGGSHLHLAPVGSNGGVEIALNATTSSDLRSGTYAVSDNSYELTADQKTALMNRELYANVHTAAHGAGEIRAQLLPVSNLYFQGTLSGMNEVDPDTSSGMGGVAAELRGTELTLTGSFSGLISDFNSDIAGGSHLHIAGADQNGGIAFALNANTSSDLRSGVYAANENTFTLSPDTASMLRNEMMYANIHSETYAPGELRGQLLLSPNMAPDSSMITLPQDGASLTIEGTVTDSLQFQWEEADDPNGNEVVYIYQLSTDGSFSNENLAVNFNAGATSEMAVSYPEVDSLLSDLTVSANDSVELYHRIITSDGSQRTTGEASMMTLVRGSITNTKDEPDELPDSYSLYENYPNPFNPVTTIKYSLPERSQVQITIYDVLGRRVVTLVNKVQEPGQYSIKWNAKDRYGGAVSTGVYFYRIHAGDYESIKKMVYLK
ncbi:MAG: CHRD domain-containing protein [Candidatus Marinimicrobia bacterium]|nr:CHRD domain-containing protein [Candidatus Neomarinimicrobiota bacterium]MCF7830371.1 CHRD domain-containing protein [Candidatus Neomarinimicrobiota bacterium]MCF7882169.1 CHRD domain-containing protein [Candidatus Neomarinimicrobiota bacterium]